MRLLLVAAVLMLFAAGAAVAADEAPAGAPANTATAFSDEVVAALAAADAALAAGRAGEAVRRLEPLAAAGNAVARHNLALLLVEGRGAPKDEARAAGLMREAARDGLLAAQNNMGLMYLRGRGVERDPAEAVRWLALAARNGHALARENLKAVLNASDADMPDVLQSVAQASPADVPPTPAKAPAQAPADGAPEAAAATREPAETTAEAADAEPAAPSESRVTPMQASGADRKWRPMAVRAPETQKAGAGGEPAVTALAAIRPQSAAPAPAKPRAAGSGRAMIQVGALAEPSEAYAVAEALRTRYPDLLSALLVHVQETRLPDDRILYRARLGTFATTKRAQEVCRALKERDVACFAVE